MKIRPVSIQKYNLKNLSPNTSKQISFKGIKEDILEISKTKAAEAIEGTLEESRIKEILGSLVPENITSENSNHIIYDAQGMTAKIAKGEAKDLVLPESYALSELSGGETQVTPKQIALLKLKDATESDAFKYIQIQEKTNATPIGLNSQNYSPENLRKFLTDGNKVKITVRFRGREINNSNAGEVVLNKFIENLEDIATVEKKPKLEGRNMFAILAKKTEK